MISQNDLTASAFQTLARVASERHNYKSAIEYSRRRTDLLLYFGKDPGTRIAVGDEIMELCKVGLESEALNTLHKLEVGGATPESLQGRAKIVDALLAAHKTGEALSLAEENLKISRKLALTESAKAELKAQYLRAQAAKVRAADKD